MQPSTNLKWYGLLIGRPWHFRFLKAVFHKFYLVHSWILCLRYNIVHKIDFLQLRENCQEIIRIFKTSLKFTLHEKCSNMEFFSGPYLDTFHAVSKAVQLPKYVKVHCFQKSLRLQNTSRLKLYNGLHHKFIEKKASFFRNFLQKGYFIGSSFFNLLFIMINDFL